MVARARSAGLNPNYDYSKTIQQNRRLGLAPPDEALEDARMITRPMSALAVTMLYLVVRVLAGVGRHRGWAGRRDDCRPAVRTYRRT